MAEGHTEISEKDRDYEAPAISTLGTVDELTAGVDDSGSPGQTTGDDDDDS
jgi:hypothetical protein